MEKGRMGDEQDKLRKTIAGLMTNNWVQEIGGLSKEGGGSISQ